MDNKYAFAELQKDGIEATMTFDSKYRSSGWIMHSTDFVHYRNDVQQVRPVAEGVNTDMTNWTRYETKQPRLHAVIRFKKALSFPRASVTAGERLGFLVWHKSVECLQAIDSGGQFSFADGQCLAEDAEIVYIGINHHDYQAACRISESASSVHPAPQTIASPLQLTVA